ncbi:MAG: hypothetical protein ACI389_05210 [Methanobrevibacter sp.]|uniref:hypothetical protein n=1 Tax=Methanobrevibacter sp. TaxID=66852 RepID=UPI003F0AEA1A
MVFDKFKRLIKFNNEDYWYDDENRYFYVPNTNNQIKITAFQALVIIGDFTVLEWSAEDIFNTCDWETDVKLKDIEIFISKYSEGLMDKVIAWICDNNIECSNEDKFDYLAKYNLK